MGSTWTPAQKQATDKYKAKFDVVRFSVPKGERDHIHKLAEECGMSVNKFMYAAVKHYEFSRLIKDDFFTILKRYHNDPDVRALALRLRLSAYVEAFDAANEFPDD